MVLYYANNKVRTHTCVHKLYSLHLHPAMNYKVSCPTGDVAGWFWMLK